MLALLLLDEGSPITATIGLFKIAVVAVFYLAALYFLFHNWRTSELKPIGLGIACLLAFIGFHVWPDHYSWERIDYSEYFLVLLLCFPLIAAALVFYFSRKPRNKKLLLSGVSLSSADFDEMQEILKDTEIELQLLKTPTPGDSVQLIFKDSEVAVFNTTDSLSGLVRPLYGQVKPLLAYLLARHRIDVISLEKAFKEKQGWPFKLYFVSPAMQVDAFLNKLDLIPRKQLLSSRANGCVMIQHNEAGHPQVTDMGVA